MSSSYFIMLKRDIPERVWIYDMEWVPDAALSMRLLGLPPETSEDEAIKKLWEYADPTKDRPFLKYLFSRIVAISFLSRRVLGDRSIQFTLKTLPELTVEIASMNEASMIEEFLTLAGRAKPQLVGYNSAESDLQVLIQRGLVNEVSAPLFCERPKNKWDPGDYFQRWDNEDHLDIMRLFGGRFGMAPKLDELCRACGLPGKFTSGGDHVVDLWLAGDIKSIVEYNQIDVLNTYLVWLRIVYFCGKLSDEAYEAETMQFREFLEGASAEPGKEFLAGFLDNWEI